MNHYQGSLRICRSKCFTNWGNWK